MAALQITRLKKAFGGLPAISDVSLEVEEGERRLIIGPNGAGKTTLFNLVTGDLRPDAGQIRFNGRSIEKLRPDQRAHLGLARTYQIITLFPKDTVAGNVVLSLLGLSRERWNTFDSLEKQTRFAERVHAVLERVDLAAFAQRPVSALAYGEKRRLEIAMALAQSPRLLLLDEPLAGLSREERGGVRKLIAAIPREVTVVMIEHDMDTALDLADRISVLHYGKVLAEGTRAQVVADPKTREVYLGY
ncbi:MAG: ABC transporter ATP-binding protein [Betaproteobacteria bacterium]|nr:ABC transporter ATP-binding protein [Betaproteobacteria bacterium]